MKNVLVAFFLITSASALPAVAQEPVAANVPRQAKGAEKVVVATVVAVNATFETNSFGDRLIVSHADLKVEETLKGKAPQMISVDIEGGTVGPVTMRASDMPTVTPGERAVFFVRQSGALTHVPHDRGHSIIKLDSSNNVRGSNLSLDDVKRLVLQNQ